MIDCSKMCPRISTSISLAGRSAASPSPAVGGPVVVGGQLVEGLAHRRRARSALSSIGVRRRTGRRCSAAISSGGLPSFDGAEQAAEVVPDRPRVVGIGVAVGLGDGLRRQQAAVLAEGDEQYAVEDVLRGGEHAGRRHGGVALAQAVEGARRRSA